MHDTRDPTQHTFWLIGLMFGGIGAGLVAQNLVTGHVGFLGLVAFPLAFIIAFWAWAGASMVRLLGRLLTRQGRADHVAGADTAEQKGTVALLLVPPLILSLVGLVAALFGHASVLKGALIFGALGQVYGVALREAARRGFLTLDDLIGQY